MKILPNLVFKNEIINIFKRIKTIIIKGTNSLTLERSI